MIIAVLEKRLGLNLGTCDIYINIAGGLRVNEPALDLAIAAAIISSYRNKESARKIVAFGEIGLTGEVRGIREADARLSEAIKSGVPLAIIPKVNVKVSKKESSVMQVNGVRNIRELMEFI